MAPQIKHRTSYNDLFSFPLSAGKTRTKKRKSKEVNPNSFASKRKKERHDFFNKDPEIITIDSDSTTSDNEIKRDEKTTNSHSAENTIEDSSDNESVKIHEPKTETIELGDSETDDNNLVINISQTVNVDNIVDLALNRSVIRNNHTFSENENNVAKKSNIQRVHWTQANNYPKSWTKEMIRFYAEPCERNRYFDYERILNNLKTKPSDWWISRADMVESRRKKNFNMCRKCDKYGHTEKECTKTYVCYICGEFNHRFPRCPNTLCLTCGKPASTNLKKCRSCHRTFGKRVPCGLCGQLSHEEAMCPSKWRKYLLPDSSNQTMRLNPNRWCYNCAQKGHFGFECPLTQKSMFPPENPLLTACIDYTNDMNNNNVIFLSKETAGLLCSEEGNTFFRRLSEDTNCRIEFFRGVQDYVRIIGQENKVHVFKDKLQKLKHNANCSRFKMNNSY